ncbi:MAG TPA: D-alanine--D-alanine ligase, partial [Clostridia bacterium]|nr:D-alanine--D-alanine ligase [Clostridia bacterium]
ELFHALDVAVCFDSQIVVERALVNFVEINCAAILNGEKIIVSETECPVSWNSFLTYEEKYMGGGKMSGAVRSIPAPVDESINLEIKEMTKKIYQQLGLSGVARMDYLYDEGANKVYLNEINTIPGSLSFYLFEPLGISYEKLLDIMIDSAVVHFEKKKQNSFEFKSSVLSNFAGGIKK